ncbi:MAG: hypothetical protein RBQ91_00360 [Acholeplasma sp.]|nr:hypothetical protein [Acholeplasma sp.]
MFKLGKPEYKLLKRCLNGVIIFIGLILIVTITANLFGIIKGDLDISDKIMPPVFGFLIATWFYDYLATKEKVDELEEKLSNKNE